VPGLPAQSLRGSADTLNASLRFTTAPSENWRLHASLTRDERDNETPVASYVPVSTDMFVGAPRTNQPYSFTQDRLKLSADYRGPGTVKVLFGGEYDARQRTLQEVDTTRETTLFGRLAMQPLDNLSVALKLAHADRNVSDYNNVAWINPAENPLLRKYNMAERVRDTAGLRADLTVAENVTLGFDVDWSQDDYAKSTIGLTEGNSLGVGGDLSVALSEATQLQLFGHSERIRSHQAGSQQYGPPDWLASNRDESDVLGIGLRHVAIKDKLDLGADFSYTRTRSDVTVETGALTPAFPAATTTLDRLKLFATYRVRPDLSLTASYWFERYESQDWRLDGVAPDTIPNLLAFGEQSPRYRVNVFSLVARYSF
jgi:MtrB/PioB family decaheme-associated outer membrane protein